MKAGHGADRREGHDEKEEQGQECWGSGPPGQAAACGRALDRHGVVSERDGMAGPTPIFGRAAIVLFLLPRVVCCVLPRVVCCACSPPVRIDLCVLINLIAFGVMIRWLYRIGSSARTRRLLPSEDLAFGAPAVIESEID